MYVLLFALFYFNFTENMPLFEQVLEDAIGVCKNYD